MRLRFGSLFSGVGGIDLGLERAGMECRWQVEIDPYCCRVLEKHWPKVPKYGDIRELSGEELEPVDLIAGGFPCQPVSLAGKRLAQDDERWLWPEFARIVRVVGPRYVLVENVPGLLSGGMGDVLGDLAALGFDAEWSLLSAAEMGAPHIRERVWIVAYATRHLRRASGDDGPTSPDWSGTVADSESFGRELRAPSGRRAGRLAGGGSALPDAERIGRDECWLSRTGRPEARFGSWWATEPAVGRVAHGVPCQVDRLRALGNAVVPQCAQWIGERIVTADRRARDAATIEAARAEIATLPPEVVAARVSAMSRRG